LFLGYWLGGQFGHNSTEGSSVLLFGGGIAKGNACGVTAPDTACAVEKRPVHATKDGKGKVVAWLLAQCETVDSLAREPYYSNMSAVSETWRYIVRSAGVRGGNAIVANTRIAVHDVIGLLQNGETIETVRSNCFPGLTRSQVYECLAYYEDHRGEIDLLVARQMSAPSP
jgi:uncharacterized protein (DUF433 family)